MSQHKARLLHRMSEVREYVDGQLLPGPRKSKIMDALTAAHRDLEVTPATEVHEYNKAVGEGYDGEKKIHV